MGPVLACALALRTGDLTSEQIKLAVVLSVLAAIGERYPLWLTHKTTINAASAAFVAMLLTLPTELLGLLVLLSMAIGLGVRRHAHPTITPPELLFNIGQGTLYTSAGAIVYELARRRPFGPDVGDVGSLGPIVIAAVAMYLVNTGAVAGAAGFQLGISPIRVWRQNVALDLMPQLALTAIGILAATIAIQSWYLLPVLALPGLLLHRAVRETIRLRGETRDALAALAEVIELRDPYTAGHSKRVAATARLIAHELGLTEEEADIVESAGRVHDIGKVALDPQVLLKTSRLSDDEWAQMQLHPVHGSNVVDRFAAYRQGASFVRHHHERWDGTGYPDRIRGEEIPLGARILAVADAYDAMTSDRPYRAGMALERALAILEEGAGAQWDPRVVAAFMKVMAERADDVPIYQRSEAALIGPAADTVGPRGSTTEAA